ncbi:MAG: calcium-binding protein, partial [Microcystaceae cyanobacterium]
DAVIEFFNNGVDTIESPFTWTLATNLENLVLTGTSHLNGTGNELDNTLSGNSGNNILDGLLGGDRLMGGLGNDTYIVDNIRDVVTENANEGQDLVQATVNTTLTNNVEDLTLLGTANINGTGNNANNILTGNSGANLLKGLNGNDTLSGGAGNDTLIGGLGNDRLTGGEGADQFLFGSGSAFKTSNLGVDTLTDFTKNSDKIALSKVTYNALISPVGTLQTAEFVQINSSLSNELSLVGSSSEKVVYNQTTGNLFYNPDGATSGLTN